MCFELREAQRKQKDDFEKLSLFALLKTENPLISQDSYSRSTCELLAKCLKCIRLVSWEAVSHKGVTRESQNSMCKILEEMKISFLISTARLRMAYSQLTRESVSEGVFQQNRYGFLEKLSKHKCYTKTLSKKKKYAKIFLGLIIKQLSIHITFEHIQLHK